MRHIVILAGGGGVRFWPISRPDRPKQFLRLFGDASLLGSTVARCRGLVPPSRIWIVTGERHVSMTRREAPRIPGRQIIGEPVGRNSAAAVGLAAAIIHREDPDAVLMVLPADHHLPDPGAFRPAAVRVFEAAEFPRTLVTMGIRPTYPATGYGYLSPSASPGRHSRKLRRFVEKPPEAAARRLIAAGACWNAGIFAGRADTFLEALRRFSPRVARPLAECAGAWGRRAWPRLLKRAYRRLPAVSFDVAVMERATGARGWSVRMVPGRFAWSDVGTWRSLADLQRVQPPGAGGRATHLPVGSRNCFVFSEEPHLVATLGVEDLVVVHTPGATLVARRADAERVRDVVEALKRR